MRVSWTPVEGYAARGVGRVGKVAAGVKLRKFSIWLLLRIYPAAWRREFGAEFEELLQRWPLSVPVMVNVIAGALSERVIDLFRRIAGGGEMAVRTFGARYDRLTKIVSGGV